MKPFGRYGIIFGTAEEDVAGRVATSILEEKGCPTIVVPEWKNWKKFLPANKVFIVFFTPQMNSVGRCNIRCAAHEFLDEPVFRLVSPLVIACNFQGAQDKEKFEISIIDIAKNYFRWAILNFSIISSPNNSSFPPWGEEPNGQYSGHKSERIKNFIKWKKIVEIYLENLNT